jgi:uncharacterized membrane protein YdjX (TVP38/TMEM64 family)
MRDLLRSLARALKLPAANLILLAAVVGLVCILLWNFPLGVFLVCSAWAVLYWAAENYLIDHSWRSLLGVVLTLYTLVLLVKLVVQVVPGK